MQEVIFASPPAKAMTVTMRMTTTTIRQAYLCALTSIKPCAAQTMQLHVCVADTIFWHYSTQDLHNFIIPTAVRRADILVQACDGLKVIVANGD